MKWCWGTSNPATIMTEPGIGAPDLHRAAHQGLFEEIIARESPMRFCQPSADKPR